MPNTPKNEHVSVELLRSWADNEVPWHDTVQIPRGIVVAAADEIERLRAENTRLEAENASLKAQADPALVAHEVGFATVAHAVGAPCSRCQPPPRCELCQAPVLPPAKPIGRTLGACWCPDCIDGWQRR